MKSQIDEYLPGQREPVLVAGSILVSRPLPSTPGPAAEPRQP